MLHPTPVHIGAEYAARVAPADGAHLKQQLGGELTPASAAAAAMHGGLPAGMASPMSPVEFAAPQGPVPRGRHAQQQSSQQHHYADPWSTAASNPFPNSSHAQVPGAQIGYYAGGQNVAPMPSSSYGNGLHSVPSMQFDSGSSSFSLPSGQGESPLPDDQFLPSISSSRRAKKGLWQWLRVKIAKNNRSTRNMIVLAGVALVVLIVVFLLVRARGGGGGVEQVRSTQRYIPPTSGARVRSAEQVRTAPIVNTPVEVQVSNEQPPTPASNSDGVSQPTRSSSPLSDGAGSALSHDEHHKLRAAAAAARHHAHGSSSSASKSALLDQGLAEIRRLKANLKDMKLKLKAELTAKARAAAQGTQDDGEDPEGAYMEDDAMLDPDDVEGALARYRLEHPEEDPSRTLEEEEHAEAEAEAEGDEGQRDDENDHFDQRPSGAGYYDYFVSEWGPCSATCGQGVQTRNIICQHTKSGRQVDLSVCEDVEPPPRDTRTCTMAPCKAYAQGKEQTNAAQAEQGTEGATDAAAVAAAETAPIQDDEATRLAAPISSGSAHTWPTLAQYAPEWSVAEKEVNSCPATRWGREFINRAWLNSDTDPQCGVEPNGDEHASVELVRFPMASLPHLANLGATPEQLRSTRVTDSFYKMRHALFHPTPVRYTLNSKSPLKETLSGEAAVDREAYAISLDCTSVSDLRARTHTDPAAASFLRSLHFLNPHAPPLVAPEDPSSKSIFTRAFERMTDAEFETTTVFVTRSCRAPYSAAQCAPDLFAVFALAHAIKVEFAQLRIIFLDDEGETPFFPAWTKLAREGQVFTRTMWSDLRVAPFDEDDVYATNAIYLIPSAVHTLWTMGENMLAVDLASPAEALDRESFVEKQRCAGQSALHQAFNHLMADVFLGFGAHATSDVQRAQQVKLHLQKHTDASKRDVDAAVAEALAPHKAPPVLLVAPGGGGGGIPSSKMSSEEAALVLQRSGAKVSNMPSLLSTLDEAFPSLRVHSYPLAQGFLTQLSMLTHANVLLAARNSVAFNTLLFASHPQQLHVIETRAKGDTPEAGRRAVNNVKDPTVKSVLRYAEQALPMSTTQGGLDFGATPPGRVSGTTVLPVVPSSRAVFSGRWLCEKLGCASFHELPAAEEGATALSLDVAQVVDVLEHLSPAVVPPPIASAGAASAAADKQKAGVAQSVPLEEYTPTDDEVAAETAAFKAAAAARAEARAAQTHAPASGGPSRPYVPRTPTQAQAPSASYASNGNAGLSHDRPEDAERVAHQRAPKPFIRKGLKARAAALRSGGGR